MPNFKIEYDPSYIINKYILYKNTGRWFEKWEPIGSFESLEKAEAEIKILKDYPKYYKYPVYKYE